MLGAKTTQQQECVITPQTSNTATALGAA